MPVHQLQRVWPIGVSTTARLAQHPDGRNLPQSHTMPDGTSLQDTPSCCWYPVKALLLNRAGDMCYIGNKQHQQHYYNRHAKPLHPIKPGETVGMRLPGQKTWTAGTCTGQTGPHSYDVRVGETVYRRNCHQLIQANEPPILDIGEPEPLTSSTDSPPQQEQAKQLPDQASATPVLGTKSRCKRLWDYLGGCRSKQTRGI